MFLQRGQRVSGVLAGRALGLGRLLILGNVLLMILGHVFGEHPVKSGAVHLGHLIVIGLLLFVRSARRRHVLRLGHLHGLLIGVAVIGFQHFPECFDRIAAAVLLRELAHFNFGVVAFDRLGQEFLRGFLLGRRQRCGEDESG